MAVAIASLQPVHRGHWHACRVELALQGIFALIYGLNDVAPVIGVAPRRLSQGFWQGRRAKCLHNLAQGHGVAAKHRVHLARGIAVEGVFSRAEGHKAKAILRVGQLKNKGSAKGSQFAIQCMHGIVEV